MAEFKQALALVLKNEGSYSNDPVDVNGGETYKGIARKQWPNWEGWSIVDSLRKSSFFPSNLDTNPLMLGLVEQFYRDNFWNKILGDSLSSQESANCIFDFAVNAGIETSKSLAMLGIDVDQPYDTSVINNCDTDSFLKGFTLVKIARYISICKKRPDSKKYFFGWVTRALGDVK